MYFCKLHIKKMYIVAIYGSGLKASVIAYRKSKPYPITLFAQSLEYLRLTIIYLNLQTNRAQIRNP